MVVGRKLLEPKKRAQVTTASGVTYTRVMFQCGPEIAASIDSLAIARQTSCSAIINEALERFFEMEGVLDNSTTEKK